MNPTGNGCSPCGCTCCSVTYLLHFMLVTAFFSCCRVMCRNELLMKIAAVSLVTLDIKPADMAALLMCYGGARLRPMLVSVHVTEDIGTCISGHVQSKL